jgi:hypothetical protein
MTPYDSGVLEDEETALAADQLFGSLDDDGNDTGTR